MTAAEVAAVRERAVRAAGMRAAEAEAVSVNTLEGGGRVGGILPGN